MRSAGGWAAVRALRRGREPLAADERVLGSGAFVERLRHEVEAQQPPAGRAVGALLEILCQAVGVEPEALRGGGRRPAVSRVLERIA